jgi:tRNA 2-thiouridine synthesizing protein E
MTDTLLATLDLDAEGYLQKPEQWTESIGLDFARSLGIEMTDRHWQVVKYMRQRFLDTGSAPSIRTLGKESGVEVKELYTLFPKGPAKLAAKIAGIPKPKGCI